MPLEGHWQRVNTPLRETTGRERKIVAVALGLLLVAAIAWRLPYIRALEAPAETPPADGPAPEVAPAAPDDPAPTHTAVPQTRPKA